MNFARALPTSSFRTAIATLALLALPLIAAPATAQPVSLGVKGGVAQGTLLGDDVADASYRAGFSGGVYATVDVNPAFSIQPEVNFTTKGADETSAVTGDGEYELQSIDIPVLFKLNAPVDGVFQPSLYAGPQLGFTLNGELNGQDIDDDALQTAEFGGVVGGDVGLDVSQYNVGPLSRIVLDGRYAFGFTNAFDVEGDPSVRTGTFIGSLGLEFAL
jgi:hypothetical protein